MSKECKTAKKFVSKGVAKLPEDEDLREKIERKKKEREKAKKKSK